MTGPLHPPLEPVRTIIALLEAEGLAVAVGGSAVLAWLGLVPEVRDWDVTVSGDAATVARALEAGGLTFEDRTSREGPFATQSLLSVHAADHSIDVLVGFALRDGDRTVTVPVRVAGHWMGLPIAHPADWQRAYTLMNRTERAETLANFLADSDWIDR